MESLIPNTIAILSITTTRWADLIDNVPADLLTRTPVLGEWSAAECLQHLIDTERWVFPSRTKAFLAGEDFPAFDPESQGSLTETPRSPKALLVEFTNLRRDSLLLLKALTTEDLSCQAVHAELGEVTLGDMLNEWVAHDLMHTVQAERALMQPFIEGCGPWQPFFSDHYISSE